MGIGLNDEQQRQLLEKDAQLGQVTMRTDEMLLRFIYWCTNRKQCKHTTHVIKFYSIVRNPFELFSMRPVCQLTVTQFFL